MLKVSNKQRKNEQLETMQVIDKCTKIMKEDRLQLRQMIKDENIKIIELVAKHKKKQDLNDLQQELRKFLKEKKYSPEKQIQQPAVVLRKVKSKERCEWNSSMNTSIRSPSRSNLDFRKKHKDDHSHRKIDSQKKQEAEKSEQHIQENNENIQDLTVNQQDLKLLDEIQEVKPTEQQIAFDTANSVIEPFQEDLTPVKMEFQTIVSQAPLNQSDQKSECILQYNVAEIQQYMQPDKHYISKEVYTLPQLNSLSFKQIVNPEYSNLFTDWKQILKPQQPTYHIKINEPSHQQIKALEIRGVTAEELFTYLVHHRFTKRMNLYQIIENAKITIPNAQLDLESLFKLADQDEDGWISLEELGQTLQETCLEKEQYPNIIKQIYNSQNSNMNFENFMTLMNDRIQGEILYHEIDLFSKGHITYWEMYNHFEEIEQLLKH